MLTKLKEWTGLVCAVLFFALCGIALVKGHYDALWMLAKIFLVSLIAIAAMDTMVDVGRRFLRRKSTGSGNSSATGSASQSDPYQDRKD